ncbi:hypothetical protein BC941DRAFT_471279 [Chlamydoabsidia padenii]|nr:hypothetical protein BC941DRAFT_471279 [Chlamydoabsidia padenii]
MNDAPIVIEPRALTTLNNRPRSGSWSNYQYYKQQQQQQRRQQKQTLLQEAKHSKTNFFTKYIQKRPISTNATTYDEDPLDDESCLVELQQPPLTDVQLPMVSRLLSNGPDQLSKRKKDKRLGRFLKRLGKNAATFMNSDNDNHCPQTVTLPEHMQEQPMHGQDIPVTEPLPTNSPIHQHPIITTSVVTNTQSTIHHYKVNHLPKSTLDDIHLHYHHTMNDRMTFAPTMPRSTSFDTTRLRKQTTTPVHRLFAPNTKPLYHTLPTCTSPKDARILLAGIHDSSPNETLDSEQQEDVDGDSEEDYHSDSEDGSIDSEVDDSHTIDGGDDHLSKRLSGGHFGSAGGLIVNTLSLSELSTISNTKSLHPDDIDDDRPVEPVSPLVQSGQMEDEQEGDGSSTQYNMDSLVGIATSASLRHVNGDNDAQYEDDDSAQLSPQSSSVNELSTMEATAEDYARRIWEQDDTVYSSLEHVAEWIGNGSPSSRLILKTYMSYFDFDNVRLEDAFRQVKLK